MPDDCDCGVAPGQRHAVTCARKRHNMRKRIRRETREAVYRRDGYRCVRCGAADHLSLDHVVSLIAGGTNHFSNLQTLCRDCNQEKD